MPSIAYIKQEIRVSEAEAEKFNLLAMIRFVTSVSDDFQ